MKGSVSSTASSLLDLQHIKAHFAVQDGGSDDSPDGRWDA